MIIIIFILFYLLPIFLIHIVGLYFWKKRTDCGKTIGDMYEYYEEDFDPKLELKVSLRKIRIKCKHEEKIVSYKSFIKGMTKCKYCVGKKKIYISPTDIYKQKLLKIAKDTIITDK